MPAPVLGLLAAGMVWLTTAIGIIVGKLIAESGRYLFRAAAVTAMAAAFIIAFNVMYQTVKSVLNVGVSYAQASQASLGVNLDFALCLIPSTLAEAITVLFSVMIQAVAVRWTRLVLFAKLA